MKILWVGAKLLHADGGTDRDDEANSRFSQFFEKRLTTENSIIGSIQCYNLIALIMLHLIEVNWYSD